MHNCGTAARVAAYVNEKRLWRRLMELARIGATDRGGVCRLALSDEEIKARKLLISWAFEINLSVFTDDISNLFFRLEGDDPEAAPVMTGSHIDTQPKGGRFDGAFGVLAGFEVLHAIREAGVTLKRSVEAVAWLNEEGSRFSPGMMGSEAFTGYRPIADILLVEDASGTTTQDELERIQAAFTHIQRRPFGFPVASFIEAHIEQGPLLEAAAISVGVVTGIQGSRRFRVRVTGDEAHAGTTPMAERKDALFVAIEIIQAMRRQFVKAEEQLKFTTGLFEISPNVPSVIPSSAYFSIDIRHPDWSVLKSFGDLIPDICEQNRGLCTVTVKEIATSESLEFPQEVRNCIANSADMLKISHMPIYSLAGHDARQLHYHCPTGMIFVPCHKGISHNEAESCEPEDLATGTRVLAATIAQLAA